MSLFIFISVDIKFNDIPSLRTQEKQKSSSSWSKGSTYYKDFKLLFIAALQIFKSFLRLSDAN